MNYIKIYNNLIFKAQNRILSKDIYVERHHILPKCLVKDIEVNKLVWFRTLEDKDKLVKLLPEEHFDCHELLVKIYPEHYGLVYSFHFMSTLKKYNRKINRKEYAWLRIEFSKNQGKRIRENPIDQYGEKNPMYHHVYTEETRQKMKKLKTEEHKKKIKDFLLINHLIFCMVKKNLK